MKRKRTKSRYGATSKSDMREHRLHEKEWAGSHRRWMFVARYPDLNNIPSLPRHGFGRWPQMRGRAPLWETRALPMLAPRWQRRAPWFQRRKAVQGG